MRLFLFLASLGTSVTLSFAASAPIVDLGYASYQGSVNEISGNIEFLGIRFAAPPTGIKVLLAFEPIFHYFVGFFRWREPQPPEVTPGVQLANTFPNTCWLGSYGTQLVSPFSRAGAYTRRQIPRAPLPSEDCLFLKYAPAFSGFSLSLNVSDILV